MKKSELRKIIRESIKEYLKEEAQNEGIKWMWWKYHKCGCSATTVMPDGSNVTYKACCGGSGAPCESRWDCPKAGGGHAPAPLFEKYKKKKGADGKACWKGYRYAGTEDGKDKCVPMGEAKPAKGKRFAKKVKGKGGRTRTVSYGQAGKAKGGGDRIRPGTKKAHAYCARSAKIKKCKNPPCANTLSRKKWKCRGTKSMK